jgi:hypothetical protein
MKLSLVVDDFVKRQCVNYKTFYFVVFFSNNFLRGIVLESKFWLRPKADFPLWADMTIKI